MRKIKKLIWIWKDHKGSLVSYTPFCEKHYLIVESSTDNGKYNLYGTEMTASRFTLDNCKKIAQADFEEYTKKQMKKVDYIKYSICNLLYFYRNKLKKLFKLIKRGS